MCSVVFQLLKWDWGRHLCGHSYDSREDRSHNTGITSSLPVFVKDQPLQRLFLYTSALYGIIMKI